MEKEQKIENDEPKKWYRYLLNKYVLLIIAFVIWMFYFDQNSILRHRDMDNNISELEKDKIYFKQKIIADSLTLKEIIKHPEENERIAREKYLMKRDNEDIFVIVDEKDSTK